MHADHTSVAHSGTFELKVPPALAIHLFTAHGERLWVDGWDPVILSGDGTAEGTVFVTSHGDETTVWVVVDFDESTYRARYARLTPGSRAGTVEVQLRDNGDGGSTVTVTYGLTALSEAGARCLQRFDADAYAEMLAEWPTQILEADIDYEAQRARQ